MRTAKLICLFGLIAAFAVKSIAAEGIIREAYNQNADLAILAAHENERMHYILLNSRVRPKSNLWAEFAGALDAFGEVRYQALKPLILERDISELQASVLAGEFSYEDLTTFYLYRIRKLESDNSTYLNAIIALNPEAIEQAQALDRSRQIYPAQDRDPIHGMPILLKDNINAEGMATTAGAVALAENFTGDAFITERLREKGAIILGKANLSEWAYFFCDDCPSGYSAMGGQTLNPYGRFEFNTGGSSAGSGAGIAANYAAAAVGSETSGSILSPSSANSLVGLKPTTGSLSRSGVIPISASLDTVGPMTRSVADAVILFNAMAGYDQADTAMPLLSQDHSLVHWEGSLAEKRLGALDIFLDDRFYSDALRLLGEEEAAIVEVVMPEYSSEDFGKLLGAEMKRDLGQYLESYAAEQVRIDSVSALQAFNEADLELRAPYGQAEVDRMVDLNFTADETETLRADLQDGAKAVMEALFESGRLDLLLSVNNQSANFAALANYPALTIPMGYEDDGRPVGLTLIAPPFSEQLLIDVGARFEALSRMRRLPSDYQ
ncbi:MAG: amidase family protein [Gammaproteobacteria bacterium]|nr:amidase family protein [Gammaproteobacteria bacterium]MCY4357079.1 amidase family protein [Gammaproteobacteria bacterium]